MNVKNSSIIVSSLLIGFLFLLTLGWYWYRSTQAIGLIINDDVAKLATIFEKIDSTAGIAGFDYQKNPINFLNVRSFVGSEIGSMNVKYPKKWQGPYLDDNPSIQGKDYMVVKTKKGYYITPGEGVKLPNGLVIGVDVKLDEDADIDALVQKSHPLEWKGKALASPLKSPTKTEVEKVYKLED